MSQSPNKATSSRNGSSKSASRARRVLVAQRAGSGWHLLVAEAASPDGRKARVLETASGGSDPSSVVKDLTEKHRPDATIGVLTSGEAICRVVEVPEGHDSELSEAAGLLAEAELPPSIEPYRKAGGIVPLTAAPGFRSAMLVGWPDRATVVDQSVPWVSWCSEIVGLAELLLLARVGGATGPRVVGSLDRENGCIGVVASGVDGHALRTVLEDASEPEAFAAAADRCLQGAGQKVNASSVPVAHSSRSLLIEPDVRSAIASAVSGVRDDDSWFASYGAALGVACAALRSNSASSALFDLRTTPPALKRSLAERSLVALRSPAVAGGVIAAALLIALLVPLGVSYARLAILDARIAEAEEALANTEAVDDTDSDEAAMSFRQRVAMYRELDRQRWPMTKLLADISAALPVQTPNELTLVDSINISNPSGFRVEGYADSLSLVTIVGSELSSSPIFSEAGLKEYAQIEGGSGAYEFSASGKIVSAFHADGAFFDYAETNVAERIYENDDTEVWRPGSAVITAVTRPDSASGRASSRSRSSSALASRPSSRTPSRTASGSGSDEGASTEVASAGGTESSGARTDRREMFQGGSRTGGEEEVKPIPDPLTDEEIAGFNQLQAMKESVARRTAARQQGVSEEDKRRLEEESDKLRARAREAQQEGG
ncbi:MAG: PilN domain-containing protein [Phycisphaerales bacterium JB050]